MGDLKILPNKSQKLNNDNPPLLGNSYKVIFSIEKSYGRCWYESNTCPLESNHPFEKHFGGGKFDGKSLPWFRALVQESLGNQDFITDLSFVLYANNKMMLKYNSTK